MKGRACALPALLLLLVPLLAGCDPAPDARDAGEPLRPVRTYIVGASAEAGRREFAGVVDAVRKAELGFRISGRLEALIVREGDVVEAGDLLARLDATDHEIQLASRQAEYDQAAADLRRGSELVEKGVISRSEFDGMQAREATARANLKSAQQTVAYTLLRAPFAGRVAERHVDNHEEVAAMQAVYSLHDLSSLVVTIDVPERVMIRLREGRSPRIGAVFDSFPEQRFPLTVDEVSTRADADTNTFRVRLRMPAIEQFNVLPGMSVTVSGTPDPAGVDGGDTVVVPARAVLEDEDGRFAYVVTPAGEGRGVVERRAVATGRLSGAGLEITRGLVSGDRVVIAGMSQMRPGLEVRLLPESPP